MKVISAGVIKTNYYEHTPHCISFAPDGKTLASIGDGLYPIMLWDVERKRKIKSLKNHHSFFTYSDIYFNFDGSIIITLLNGKVMLWDVKSGEYIDELPHPFSSLRAITFNSNNNILAIEEDASRRIIELWEIKKERKKQNVIICESQESNCFSESREIVSVGKEISKKITQLKKQFKNAKIKVVKTCTVRMKKIHTLQNDDFIFLESFAFNPAGNILAIAVGDYKFTDRNFKLIGNIVILWDIKAKKEIISFKAKAITDYISLLSFSPVNENILAIASSKILELWDINKKKGYVICDIRYDYDNHLSSLAFSNDGKVLAFGLWDGTIKLLDIQKRRKITIKKTHNRIDIVSSIAFGSSNIFASISSNDTIELWQLIH